jgi:gluconolactonase
MAEVRVIARGLAFPEGPAIAPDGGLVVTEIAGGQITRVHPDGRTEPFSVTGGGPNGCAFGPDGALYVCNNGGSWPVGVPSTEKAGKPPRPGPGVLQRQAPGGEVEVAVAEIDGQPLNAPNDLAFDAQGGVYFTDPVWDGRPGAICYLGPDGVARRCHVGLRFPNGIGVTADGRFVVACESMTGMLWSFKVSAPGVLGDPKPNGHIGRRSVPDGFCFDSAGRMIVAGHNTNLLFVLEEGDGRPVEAIELPDAGPTNCCFGGPDHRTLYVTSSDVGDVLAIEWPVPGMKLPG